MSRSRRVRYLAVTTAMFAFGVLNSVRAGAQDTACSAEALDRATTPVQARALAALCVDTPSVHFQALDKLNAMPLPPDIPTFVPKSAGAAATEKISFAMDVFFDVDEAYPIPVGLDKLAELVRYIGGRGEVDSIVISSSENAFEQGATIDVAQRRTAFVHRYLVSAGIDEGRISGKEQPPDHGDTPLGRAQDRCARIEVVMRRQKAPV